MFSLHVLKSEFISKSVIEWFQYSFLISCVPIRPTNFFLVAINPLDFHTTKKNEGIIMCSSQVLDGTN